MGMWDWLDQPLSQQRYLELLLCFKYLTIYPILDKLLCHPQTCIRYISVLHYGNQTALDYINMILFNIVDHTVEYMIEYIVEFIEKLFF